ncbi:uncharacterized protein [Anser cygnoides]|uniref:uncharacterized protein isoform X2 n=1 Tax=Anser cygnoides TaxID=8845 RepID=UPI0034D29B16
MEQRPPSRPRVAWEEDESSQESSSLMEPIEVCEVEPLQPDAIWLPVYEEEEEAVDFIEAYVRNPERVRAALSMAAVPACPGRAPALLPGCWRAAGWAELLPSRRPAQLRTPQCCGPAGCGSPPHAPSWYLCGCQDEVQKMKFLRNIITVCTTAQEKGLLEGLDIFCSRNKLAENIQALLEEKPVDYLCTDVWQEALLATAALSNVETALEGEMLSLVAACISRVFFLLRNEDLDTQITVMILENLDIMLKSLLISSPGSSVWEKFQSILEVLLYFTTSSSIVVQANATERIWKLVGFLHSCFCEEPFGKYIQPSQRTAIVLRTLEMMRNYSMYDDEYGYAEFILDIAIQDPASWLMDVPNILRFIHESLSNCTTAEHLKLFSVLCILANEFPRELLISILTDLPTLDSTTLDIWKATLSLPMNSEEILQELQNVLRDKRVCSFFEVNTVDLSTVHLAMMRPKDQALVELCDPERLQVCLRLQSLPMLSLALRALTMLSERPKMGRKLLVLLPDVMNTLLYDNRHITEKALTVFENVIGHLEKREASPIALALAERLLPLFNNESSEVQERSILLFKDLMECVVWWKKGEMKKTVRRALIPLLFRMSDETESVAKASAVVLLACTMFLKWKQLEHLAQNEDITRIREYLLKQKSSRVDEYLQQSLPYLEDAQANLRQEAVKFIALQLVTKDVDSSLCVLAAQTILCLRSRIKRPIPLWVQLAELFCWPCIARAYGSV